ARPSWAASDPAKTRTPTDPAPGFRRESALCGSGGNLRRLSVLSYADQASTVEDGGDPYSTLRSHEVYSASREPDVLPQPPSFRGQCGRFQQNPQAPLLPTPYVDASPGPTCLSRHP